MKIKKDHTFSVYDGYSDNELEQLSNLKNKLDAGKCPWMTWESENSSFGRTFRIWAKYPSFLPLCFVSDHGVHHFGSRCWPNEVSNKLRVVFTWNRKKSEKMKKEHGKNSYHVPHPWINYRKKYYPELPEKRSGTVVFYAHSNNTTTPEYEDLESYFSELRDLPKRYQPVVLCLSFHDIQKGLHKQLRKYNLPLITAGSTNSQYFVDRFYSMVYRFRYSTSSNIGSHTFYLIEAGIPFFLLGPYPKYDISGSEAVNDGKQNLSDYGDAEDLEKFESLKHLLSSQRDSVTNEQRELVSEYLGLNSKITRFEAAWIIWRELFLNIFKLPRLYGNKLVNLKKILR